MNAELLHRLGAVVSAVTAVVCVAAAVVGARRDRAARQRLISMLGAGCARGGRSTVPQGRPTGPAVFGGLRDRWTSDWLRVLTPPLGVGLAGWLMIGGLPGCVVGLAAAYCMRTWWRVRPETAEGTDGPVDPQAVAAQLPLAADLLAACLAAGAGLREAAEEVGNSLGGPVGGRLAQAAAELRLGAEPSVAWDRLGELPGARGLARCLEHTQATGVPAVEPVTRLAVVCRAEQARTAAARARRAGVLATIPLGLCFLPAFLVIGVAPVLIGLASGLLSAG